MSALESNLMSLSLQQRRDEEEDKEVTLEGTNHNNKLHKVKGKHNKHTEPFVLSEEALFMWPEIASFCPPWQVIALETVCTKIRQTLADASVGTRLMNRYWNAQWARLIWGDDEDNVHEGDDDNSYKKENNDGNVNSENNSSSNHEHKNDYHNICYTQDNKENKNNNCKDEEKCENAGTSSFTQSVDDKNEDTSVNPSCTSDANNTNNRSSSCSSSSPRESSQRNSIKLVMISRDKKLLLSSALSRSEGRKDWRTMYKKEYPNWIARTFRGVGIRNNLASEDRARLMHDRGLNEIKSAAQLAREELTVQEALIKKLRKRGITIEIPNSNTSDKKNTRNNSYKNSSSNDNSPMDDTKVQTSGASSPLKLRGFRNSSPVFSPLKGNSKSVNDLVSLPITSSGSGGGSDTSAGVKAEDKELSRVAKRYAATREAGSPLTRDDYQCDRRQGARKGKHAKGMAKRWASYNEFGDYDY